MISKTAKKKPALKPEDPKTLPGYCFECGFGPMNVEKVNREYALNCGKCGHNAVEEYISIMSIEILVDTWNEIKEYNKFENRI